jgi:hypothetical protein
MDQPAAKPEQGFSRWDENEPEQTYNPWTVVNVVFHHLAAEGLRPVLGETGDPGPPAAALLEALGIKPAAEGNRQVSQAEQDKLAELRAAVFGEP